jgi:hypothetical protein
MKGSARNVLLAAAAAGFAVLLAPEAIRAQSSGYDLRKIALEGEQAPETGGETYESSFSPPAINSAGDVAFGDLITGGDPINAGIFIDSGGEASAVALFDEPAPVSVGGSYSLFGYPTLNDSGDVSFMAFLRGGSQPRAIFLASGDTDTVLVRPGDTAPDTGDGGDIPDGTYTGNVADFNLPVLNDSGGVAFSSEVTGGSVAGGVFVDSGGAEAAFALAGDPAPGIPGGKYSLFGTPSQNDAGSVAFTADVTDGAVASGLFRDSGATGAAVALVGESAPDTGGGTYTEFGYPVVNDLGYVVFLANVAGGSASGGIFLDTGASERAVAVEGGTAPETGGGTYASVTSFGALDAAGRVAFSATLTGGTIGAGVFLFDPASGQTSAVTLEGQIAPDAGGASFSEFGFVSLNDARQVAMQATLSDGSAGIFLASPVAAPVPALPGSARIGLLLSLLAVGILAAPLRRSAKSA